MKTNEQTEKGKKICIISTDNKLFFTARKEREHTKTFFLKKLDISHNAKKRQVQFFFSFQISFV